MQNSDNKERDFWATSAQTLFTDLSPILIIPVHRVALTTSSSTEKVLFSPPNNKGKKYKQRKDVQQRKELVFSTFLLLEKQLGKRPTQQQIADVTGISRKKVGEYLKVLGL